MQVKLTLIVLGHNYSKSVFVMTKSNGCFDYYSVFVMTKSNGCFDYYSDPNSGSFDLANILSH